MNNMSTYDVILESMQFYNYFLDFDAINQNVTITSFWRTYLNATSKSFGPIVPLTKPKTSIVLEGHL